MKFYILSVVISTLTAIWEFKYLPLLYPPFFPMILILSISIMLIWCVGTYISSRGTIVSMAITPFIFFQEFELSFNSSEPSFVFGISVLILELFCLVIVTWLFALVDSLTKPAPAITGKEMKEKIMSILEDLEYLDPP
ncbi:MAG: hypothetical protein M1375_02600 [Candidatus Thermoplasmatota archaeon]|jgi:hypothetical protein|nr:hypothetical protein [Candidatus Thermoplasmatota archaeon]MCL5790846.1 hypothetical protein [Candidatus Thermoplasmatota archaeon]